MSKKIMLCVCLTLATILLYAQSPKKIIVNAKDSISGYYLAVELMPDTPIAAVLCFFRASLSG
jgi:hypothetical protein